MDPWFFPYIVQINDKGKKVKTGVHTAASCRDPGDGFDIHRMDGKEERNQKGGDIFVKKLFEKQEYKDDVH